jgi:hypothetical protein
MTANEAAKAIQVILHVAEDGLIGAKTMQAMMLLGHTPANDPWPAAPTPAVDVRGSTGKATSFADPQDVSAFEACKANGGSDLYCFRKGDNGVGKWGDVTKKGSGPCCALPPEDWAPFGASARGKMVSVQLRGMVQIIPLRDTMPHRDNITNNAVIDLNYDAWLIFGKQPPCDAEVTWQWA